MPSHRLRLILISVFAVALLVLIALAGVLHMDDHTLGVFQGMLGLTFPALLDALAVERRRMDPDKRAIADDVGRRTRAKDVVNQDEIPTDPGVKP